MHESKIIKFISKKLVRKAIEMLHKLAEKEESKEEKNKKFMTRPRRWISMRIESS